MTKLGQNWIKNNDEKHLPDGSYTGSATSGDAVVNYVVKGSSLLVALSPKDASWFVRIIGTTTLDKAIEGACLAALTAGLAERA